MGFRLGLQASEHVVALCPRPSFDQSWARACTASWVWGPWCPGGRPMAHRWLQSSAQGSSFPAFESQAPHRPGEMRWGQCTGFVCVAELYGDSSMRVVLAEVCLASKFNPCLPPVICFSLFLSFKNHFFPSPPSTACNDFLLLRIVPRSIFALLGFYLLAYQF